MTHRVNYNGVIHEFPDEATPDMIKDALGLSAKEEKKQKFEPFLKDIVNKTSMFDEKNPKEIFKKTRDESVEGLIGGMSGAPGMALSGIKSVGIPIIQKLLQNPIAQTATKAAGGALAGYGIGGSAKSAAEGAGLALVAPALLKRMGIGKGHRGESIASKVTKEETAERSEAGERIGTSLTPGESSGRPDVVAEEATLGRVGEPATAKVKIGQQRIKDQQKAIENLGNKITKSQGLGSSGVRKAAQDTIQKMKDMRQEAAEPYYAIAHTKKVAPNLVKKLENELPTVKDSIDNVLSNKDYQIKGELLGEPRNSIKVLDYAKRDIDRKITQAENFGDKDAVRVLTKTKNQLLDSISRYSKDYSKARSTYEELSKPIDKIEQSQIGMIAKMKDSQLKNLSKKIFDPSETDLTTLKETKQKIMQQSPENWDRLVKNEMDRLMTQGKGGQINARSFYDKVLSNDIRFKQFEEALSHNKAALSDLRDMKKAWEHVINIRTPRTSAGQSETSMSKAREVVQKFIDLYHEMGSGSKEIQALKYIYSSQWKESFNEALNIKNPIQRKFEISKILGKSVIPSYVVGSELSKGNE